MDFLSDTVGEGRRIRALAIVDECTRESLAIEVDTSIPGQRVTRVLDRIIDERGTPVEIISDNGPEFTGAALDRWAYENGVKLSFIEPGRPTQNCYIESFNGKFRDECLNEHWFETLAEARRIIERWRQDYNDCRPHSSLGNRTPSEYRVIVARPEEVRRTEGFSQ